MITLTRAEVAGSPDFDAAFDELFSVAYRVGYRLLGSREDADDVAIEALARAWQSWDKVGGYAAAWVARVASNLAIGLLRRRRRSELLSLRSGVRAEASFAEDRRDLVRALKKLSGRQREVLVLRFIADLSEAEVAAALGCSVGAVKQHAHRAIAALQGDADLERGDGR